MDDKLKRRTFLKTSALSGLFFGLAGRLMGQPGRDERNSREALLERLSAPRPATGEPVIGLKVPPIKTVRVGLIGLGMRGSGHVELVNAMYPDKAKITALCDVRPERVEAAMATLKGSGQKPATYSGKLDSWREMVRRDDIDLIIIATPWEDHTPMAVESMLQGKHVAVEVPVALTIEDCWKLVDTAEATQRNCMMMENVCYGDEELWVLNMAQQGVFGTLTYAEAAYIHNLKEDYLFNPNGYYNMWRMRHNLRSDGNLYPTHGLGPVAQYMDIQRGDRFTTLVSMSSKQAALTEYSQRVDPLNEFYNRKDFQHGDMNNTLIRTHQGRCILVQHDVVTPRPYNRINALAGTKGYHEGYPSRLSIEGHGHGWLGEEDYKKYVEKYRHPIWDKLKDGIAKYGGHGGMDFVMMYRIIDCLNNGWPLDMDVYDGVAWSAVTPLSKLSVEMGSVPLQFPDFTRGRWQEARKLGIFANA